MRVRLTLILLLRVRPDALPHGRATDCALLFKAFAEFGDYLARYGSGAFDFVGLERDRADYRMAAAAVALADGGDVVAARARAEGVRADGDFRAEGAARDRDRVGRLGADVVGDELVEAQQSLFD